MDEERERKIRRAMMTGMILVGVKEMVSRILEQCV